MSHIRVKSKEAAIKSLQVIVDHYGADTYIGKRYVATIKEIKHKAIEDEFEKQTEAQEHKTKR